MWTRTWTSGALLLFQLSPSHEFVLEGTCCDIIHPQEECILWSLPLWNSQGKNRMVLSSNRDWISVWGPCDLFSGEAPQSSHSFSKSNLRGRQRTSCWEKPSTELALQGEKSTFSSHVRIPTLEELSPRPQMTPSPGFFGERIGFWTKSPRSFSRSEWVPCTWLFLPTMPMGEVYPSRT